MNEADCCDFGSHSVSHKNLFTLEDDKLVEELSRSKEILEKITGEEIFSFAYPNGFCTEREVISLKKQNYKLAFSVLPGQNDTPGSPFEITYY
jgi:peptidoglycan/xylan/chitin deacetylase (PgdA/CDA1 family)